MAEVRTTPTSFKPAVAVFSIVRHKENGFLFASANDAAIALLGPSQPNVLGERLEQALPQEFAELLSERAIECLERAIPVAFNGTLPGRAGSAVFVLSPLAECSSLVSITALPTSLVARLPLILEEQQRLATLGHLARGVAHDVNNVMAAALISLTAAMKSSSEESLLHQRLTIVENAIHIATLLLRKVLAVSNERVAEWGTVQLPELVSDVVNLVRPLLPRNVHVRLEFAADVRPVRGTPAELMQVVLNLCLNAIHATETNSGSVGLTVTEKHLSSPLRIDRRDLAPGAYNCLCVTDSGHGMSPETLARAFEPFFTTRGTAGTGLGLSIVRGIVEAHGGAVVAQSTLGSGTTVLVYLPIYEEGK